MTRNSVALKGVEQLCAKVWQASHQARLSMGKLLVHFGAALMCVWDELVTDVALDWTLVTALLSDSCSRVETRF